MVKVGGRTHEIQRLIGRSLRAVVDMKALGERMVILDCDVLQADGGTRTAAITGACAALGIALNRMVKTGALPKSPLKQLVAATSVGVVEDTVLLDLAYEEDSQAEVDMNIVMTEERWPGRSTGHGREDPLRTQPHARNDGLRRSRHRSAARCATGGVERGSLTRVPGPATFDLSPVL